MIVPATEAATDVGTSLVADGGFTCLVEGEVVKVRADALKHLYVPCSKGRHYLNGQLNDAGEYAGFSIVEDPR